MNDPNQSARDLLSKTMMGKVVRQHTAPPGYECNVGNVFLVGETRFDAGRSYARPCGGGWVPLEHLEEVAMANFEGDPDVGTAIRLSGGGRPTIRIFLKRDNQTVAELLAQFEEAIAWLRESEGLKRSIDVAVVE